MNRKFFLVAVLAAASTHVGAQVPPFPEDEDLQCIEDCFANGDAAYAACMEAGGDPEECSMQAFVAVDECIVECDVDIGEPPELPEEIQCADDCLAAIFESCVGEDGEPDIDCLISKEAEAEACLSTCGLEVPEPDPCVGSCQDAAFAASEECVDENGEVDFECMARVDAQFVECLSGCGIELPELPPFDPEVAGCATACDDAFNTAFEACIGEDGDIDIECATAADGTYLACLTECGIVLPECPGHAPPECLAGCDEEIAVAAEACFGENGEPDLDCLEQLGEQIDACVAACESDGETQAIRAAVRATEAPTFLRGDANSDGAVDIADAVTLLNYLFVGGTAITCRDAGDADDDGLLNVTDVITILNHLFLGAGSLPSPALEPGVDPTADELDCQ